MRVTDRKHRFGVLALLMAGLCFPAGGSLAQQSGLNPDRDEKLEITADHSLEWRREEQIFVARENALAKQGAVSIAAATLTANYREGEGNAMEIWRVTADENVVVRSRDASAYGDRAVYDIDRGVAVMTGDVLKMTSPDQTVTARESFEYWVAEGRLEAIGKAHVIRGEDTLDADRVSATFKENPQGKRVLDMLEATGNVVITTPTETLTGAYGIYRADTNTAEVTGGVTIRRGPNILEGEKAQVDLTTNISRMLGSAAPGGRVRGVFYPGSEERREKSQ